MIPGFFFAPTEPWISSGIAPANWYSFQHPVAEYPLQLQMFQMHVADVATAVGVGTGPFGKHLLEARVIEIAKHIVDEVTTPHGPVTVDSNNRAAGATRASNARVSGVVQWK